MKNEEKIRKYIDGELSGDELKNFEKEINNSPILKREIEVYQYTLNQFKKLESVNVDESYFINHLPRFRENIAKQKRLSLKPSFAIGSIIILLLTAALVFIVVRNEQEIIKNEEITLLQLDNEELNIYLNNYSQDLTTSQLAEGIPEEYDSVFNIMIENELNFNGYIVDYFVDITSNDFDNIFNELSEEELNGIYNNLITKNFK